jgi:cell division protease FtsH
MGTERKSLIISDEEKKTTAFHEAGHALVAYFVPEADPLHKVTIIPRGRALGVTMQLPTDDKHTYSREYLESMIAVLMGGRVSEELTFDKMTTGAGNDIERVTDLARRMVCEWGMSSKMGPLTFGKKEEAIFLGREIAQHRDYSEATAIEIDQEVRSIVFHGYETAKRILEEHSGALKRIAEALLDREVLDAEEVAALVRGEALPMRREPNPPPSPAEPTGEAAEKSLGGPAVLPEPGKSPA